VGNEIVVKSAPLGSQPAPQRSPSVMIIEVVSETGRSALRTIMYRRREVLHEAIEKLGIVGAGHDGAQR
jgi:hypothetical protein